MPARRTNSSDTRSRSTVDDPGTRIGGSPITCRNELPGVGQVGSTSRILWAPASHSG